MDCDLKDKRFLILGIGNPLLDQQLVTFDTTLHSKFNLATDSASLIFPENEEKLLPLFTDLDNLKESIKSIPGGSAQNTMRVFQWMLTSLGGPTKEAAAYFGAVGDDQNADVLKNLATNAGLIVRYQVVPQQNTGVCAVLVYGADRCLVAHLGAAQCFTTDHFSDPENTMFIDNAKIYYAEGYFLTVCPDAILTIAQHAAENNKPFTMSLSAPYICLDFKDQLNAILPYVDVLFGNEEEAKAYADANGFKEQDLELIVKKIASFDKINKLRQRIVVITRGKEPIYVSFGDEFKTFMIDTINATQIVDTNGAGDAFSGGYLAAMSKQRPLEKCIEAGKFAARIIIQNVGCTFPEACDYKEDE